MSFISQLLLIIIHYTSIFGLVICGLFSLILPNRRKKLLFMFLTFLFVGVLSFVYYSAILIFIVGIFIAFFFVSLYLFVFQIEFFGSKTEQDENKRPNGKIKNIIPGIVLPFLFCAAVGYLFYIYTSDFLKSVNNSGNVYIAGLSDINKLFFTEYSLILIIVIASLFISFLWFIIIRQD